MDIVELAQEHQDSKNLNIDTKNSVQTIERNDMQA